MLGKSSLFFSNTVHRTLHPKAWIRLPNICTEYRGWCRMSPCMKLLFLASLHLCVLYLFFTHIFWLFLFISSRGLQVKIWNYHQTLKEMILRYWLRTVFFKTSWQINSVMVLLPWFKYAIIMKFIWTEIPLAKISKLTTTFNSHTPIK